MGQDLWSKCCRDVVPLSSTEMSQVRGMRIQDILLAMHEAAHGNLFTELLSLCAAVKDAFWKQPNDWEQTKRDCQDKWGVTPRKNWPALQCAPLC